MFSTRAKNIQPSPTLTLNSLVRSLQATGIAVVNLAVGEPDFNTPEYIRLAAIAAIQEGNSHYTETPGLLELRQAIAKKFSEENNIRYTESEIIVGSGSKQLLYNAFQILCEAGDEVLVPIPTWATYLEQIKLSEATAVLVPLTSPFKLKATDIEPHITAKTKALLLNSPSNPTGAMIDPEELEKIAELAVAHHIWIISDEIYEKISYGTVHRSIASFNEAIREQTITVNGFSKAYAMTGWRIGYAGGPQAAIKAMSALQDQQTSNTSAISQKAAIAALSGSAEPVQKMVQEFQIRRDFIAKALADIPLFQFTVPEGAFYLLVSIEKLLGSKYATSQEWCAVLLEQYHVAVTPGEAFLAPGYFRLSYAASMEELEKAVEKIKQFINS